MKNQGDSTTETRVKFKRSAFKNIKRVGKGGYSKVWEVLSKHDRERYALKEMHKLRVLQKHSLEAVLNERRLLMTLKHPFLVNLHCAFQDYTHLYLVLDLLEGGDVRFHIGQQRRFSEAQTQFYVACLLLALEYVHSCGIIHGDLKPENLVLDSAGYLRLTDFGVAVKKAKANPEVVYGTPVYMAPETLAKEGFTEVSDYYAIGVMVHEFMLSRRPYSGRYRKDVLAQMQTDPVEVYLEQVPEGWAPEVIDFVNALLQPDPQSRLGANGLHEIKNHPWLKQIDWEALSKKTAPAPFVPPSKNNFDKAHVESNWPGVLKQSKLKVAQPLFAEYYFDSSMHYNNSTGEDNH